MTDKSRSLTIDLNPIGLESLRVSLDGLIEKYLVPREEEESIIQEQAISVLVDDVAALGQRCGQWYQGQVALYDNLVSLKADRRDKIGQKVRSYEFWSSAPDDFKLVEGDTYDKLYDLRENLSSQISCYQKEEVRREIRRLSEALSHFEFDVRLIKDGHYDPTLATYIHESWVQEESFASVLKEGDKPSAPAIGRWGDLSSSDEDTFLASAVRSLTKAKESSNPGITLPVDFDICFPMLGKRIDRLCAHYKWEKRLDRAVELKRQGLVPFEEQSDGTIKCSLQNNERLALLSLYACIGAMFLKPQTLAKEDNTEVALTYVCSVIARERLTQEQERGLMDIALKNGDGGKSVFSSRLLFLTKTGDSAVKLIFEAIDKLVGKFARELKDDQLDIETSKAITDRAFTSIDGMLGNCYRKSKSPIYENKIVPGKKGRVPIKVGEKISFSPPDLKTSRLPLKASELTKLNSLRREFNDRKTIAENRINSYANPTIFTAPLVCKEVAAEAYQKLQPLKVILKARITKIRAVATKANNGAKPGPGDWASAMTKVLSDTEDIGEEVYDFLAWQVASS